MHYISLSDEMYRLFGTKVYKLSLSSGCSCPNRDGSLGSRGCSFCSEGGSGDFASPFLPIEEQICLAKEKVDPKFPARIKPEDRRYFAYFQSFSNTYGDPDRLETLFRQTLSYPEIVGLSIGTRPDCLSDDMIQRLSLLQKSFQKPIWIELGLQTIHEKSAERIHRAYPLSVFEDSYRRLKEAGLSVIVHVILGLPGENKEDMLETVSYLSRLSPRLDGIKLQLLHILKGTELAEEYETDPFPILSLEAYTDLILSCLRILPEETVIHRLTGDGPKRLLIEPQWSADKKRVMNHLQKAIKEAKD